MATKVKRKNNFKGKMVSIGVDMHKRSWHITVLAFGTDKWINIVNLLNQSCLVFPVLSG